MALWRGWVPSVIGVVPYVGLNFCVYESLKDVVIQMSGGRLLHLLQGTHPLHWTLCIDRGYRSKTTCARIISNALAMNRGEERAGPGGVDAAHGGRSSRHSGPDGGLPSGCRAATNAGVGLHIYIVPGASTRHEQA